jgi:hypothetical protein
MIYAEDAFGNYLDEKGGIDWLRNAGLNGEVESFDELMDLHVSAVTAEIETDMELKDEVFQKLRRDQVARRQLLAEPSG